MNEVTIDHIRQAVEWARKAQNKPQPIDGLVRRYSQKSWDCGTSCCIWGAAHIIAGNGPTIKRPRFSWANQSRLHTQLYYAMQNPDAGLEDFEELLGSIVE